MGKFVFERAPTGVEGLDDITGGGLPRGRTTLLVGGPGCGKTVLALQTLFEGAHRFKEPGIFVAFEEPSKQIFANARSFGWDLEALRRRNLFFLDAHLARSTVVGGAFDLAAMLAGLSAKAREMGARRVVFDGVDMLLSMLDEPAAERREIHRLHEWLSANRLTGVLTAKSNEPIADSPAGYGFLPFLADCVVRLDHGLAGSTAVRHLRVLKYRGASVSSNEFPMTFGKSGIEVGSDAGDALEHAVSAEKVSSGVARLDTMLGGGYYRGSSVLVSGAPGTAKSTLAGAFADAACRRGERTVYFSFDEAARQIVRNLRSVDIRLGPHVDSGLLVMHSARAESRSCEEHVLAIRALLAGHRARNLVVDPVSALAGSAGAEEAKQAAERLIALARRAGITTVITSLLEGTDSLGETTAAAVSTIADTWIHLTYVVQAGERNRALTIVKSRGMGHSNQVRELVLSDRGLALADVYLSAGTVLMGTLRWEKEEADRAARLQDAREAGLRERKLAASIAEIEARIKALSGEHDLMRAALAAAQEQGARSLQDHEHRADGLRTLRRADTRPAGARPRGPKMPRKA